MVRSCLADVEAITKLLSGSFFQGVKCSRNHKAARLCLKLSAAPLMSYQVCLPLTADRQHLCDTTN